LSACEAALPMLFSVFAASFAVSRSAPDSSLPSGESLPLSLRPQAAFGVWIWLLITRRQNVHHIHWLMAVLLVVKVMALLFDGVR
jgi:ABC-type phosphate transport system permease subunit